MGEMFVYLEIKLYLCSVFWEHKFIAKKQIKR